MEMIRFASVLVSISISLSGSRDLHRGTERVAREHAAEPGHQIRRIQHRLLPPQGDARSLDGSLEGRPATRGGLLHARKVRAREEEALRVDDAVPDEGAGLAGAAAPIPGVHEPAVPLRELQELAAGPGEPLTEVVRGELQDLGRERVADLQEVADDEVQSLFAVEAEQHPQQAGLLRSLDEQPRVGGRGGEGGWLLIRGAREVVPVALEAGDRELRAAALSLEEMAHGDAVGPGAEGALSAETGEAGCDLEKAFLRCILGVCRALQDAERDVVEPGLVPAQQRLQRAGLAGEGEPHQLLVTGSGQDGGGGRVGHSVLATPWTRDRGRL